MRVCVGTARGARAQYGQASGDEVGSSQRFVSGLWALGSGLWYAWALIQPRGWLMAGAADLDQRLCGCLIIRKGPSYCAGDVSRSEGFLLAAWANRAYGDDTAGINDKPGATLGALGADAKSCWWVLGRVGGCACVVL